MSQSQVAGDFITRNMLSQLEHDQASPSLKTLEYLSSVLNVKISWLIGEEALPEETEDLKTARQAYVSGSYETSIAILNCHTVLLQEEELLLYRSFYQLGCVLFQTGDPQKALQAAETSLKHAKSCIYLSAYDEYLINVLRLRCLGVLQQQDIGPQFRSFYEQFHTFHPNNAFHLICADWALKEARLQDAKMELEQICDISGQEMGEYWLLRGALLVQEGAYPQAIPFLMQAETAEVLPECRKNRLFSLLEKCYKEEEDYRMAYHYASLRLKIREIHAEI